MKRWMFAAAVLAACGRGDEGAQTGGDASSSGDASTSTSAATGSTSTADTTAAEATSEGGGSSTGEPEPGPWQPGKVLPTDGSGPRGLLDVRGLVHTHSVYSHDACDGEPRDESGTIDATCFDDLRRALCQIQHDFVMFTDHNDFFSETPFEEALLFDAARGDVFVERNGGPVANWTGCEDVDPVLVLAGTESTAMPVGLERHADSPSLTYGEFGSSTFETFAALGAVVLVSHTEGWTVEELTTPGLHGFEMYNLHANFEARLATALMLLGLAQTGGAGLPHPDLTLFPVWFEDPEYLTRWGAVLAGGARPVTTMGTDAHRNVFDTLLEDGERIDSFRRMMQWFSNHLLIEPEADGTWDDRHLKEALRQSRLYGAFEYLGYPGGFEAHVQTGTATAEIGAEVPLADGPEIVAVAPVVRDLDPEAEAPEVTLHLMKAVPEGFEEVASADQELRYTPEEAGAYRVEVRIVPRHLGAYLGDFDEGVDEPRVWIYANPFFIR